MRAAARLLKPGGRFVFSTMHPCFNSGPVTWLMEEEDRDGEIITTLAVKVSRYIRPSRSRGLGMLGQPAPHYYFHRSLADIFSAAFRAGLVLDGLEESVFDDTTSSPRPLSWANYREITPVLVARRGARLRLRDDRNPARLPYQRCGDASGTKRGGPKAAPLRVRRKPSPLRQPQDHVATS